MCVCVYVCMRVCVALTKGLILYSCLLPTILFVRVIDSHPHPTQRLASRSADQKVCVHVCMCVCLRSPNSRGNNRSSNVANDSE